MQMKFWLPAFLVAFINTSCVHAHTSSLWGKSGEQWTAASRLPDFSHAGYREGKTPIPDFPVRVSVKYFGATGDGKTDDTQAFLDAIASAPHGAVFIPAGRYVITQLLKIDKSQLVLRGEGCDKTILYFPKSLTDVVGEGKTHAPGNSWSWSGGFITFEGWDVGEKITSVTAPARRGSSTLTVASATNLKKGQYIRVLLWNTNGTLGQHLNGGQKEAAKDLMDKKLIDFCSRIKSIHGHTVTLERPLRTDIRLEWKPLIYAHSPSVEDVGIEDVTLEFPAIPYSGHHVEPGFNAIEFSGLSYGWARRLKIVNADSGIFLRTETKFCTVDDIEFVASPARLRKGYGSDSGEPQTLMVGGHHGVAATGFAQDNMIRNFHMNFRFIHDLSVASMAAGNVFVHGQGVDMSLDHHRKAPFENLFSDLEAGEGSRLWESGGDEADGPHSGARETFWNIRSRHAQKLPDWALEGNFVGVLSGVARQNDPNGNWIDPIAPGRIVPASLVK